jgi:hypothetical protein
MRMPDCPSLIPCPFFNDRMQSIPAMAEIYKTRYCRGTFEKCARYKVSKALGREKVPSDLYPNQINRVDEILGENQITR